MAMAMAVCAAIDTILIAAHSIGPARVRFRFNQVRLSAVEQEKGGKGGLERQAS